MAARACGECAARDPLAFTDVCALLRRPDERFYGFGQQYTYLDAAGRVLPLFVREQGVGRGLQPWTDLINLGTSCAHGSKGYTSYKPALLRLSATPNCGGDWSTTYTHVPQYVTSANRSLFLASHDYVVFNLSQVSGSLRPWYHASSPLSPPLPLCRSQWQSTSAGDVTIVVNSTTVSARLLAGDSMLGLVSAYTTGQYAGPPMRPLPSWLSGGGAILGLEGGQASVQPRIEAFLDAHPEAPVAAVWLQARSAASH